MVTMLVGRILYCVEVVVLVCVQQTPLHCEVYIPDPPTQERTNEAFYLLGKCEATRYTTANQRLRKTS